MYSTCAASRYLQCCTLLLLLVDFSIPYTYGGVYHTPCLGRFSKLDCSTIKTVPIPNETSSESSRRDVSNAQLGGTGTIPTVEISTMENRPRGVWYTPTRRMYTARQHLPFVRSLYYNQVSKGCQNLNLGIILRWYVVVPNYTPDSTPPRANFLLIYYVIGM